MSAAPLADDVRPREMLGWAMYDFANSGYTTVVITAVYNAWFVAGIAGNAPWATFAWTVALSLSYAAIILTAPWIGAWADAHGAKKRVLAWTTCGCVLFTAALAWPGPGEVALAMLLVALSNFCFGTGENVVAAFLPELARGEAMGKVSAWGWSLGYLGGLLTLGLCLAWISHAQGRQLPAGSFMPPVLLITALVFALASLPTFLWLRERARPGPAAGDSHPLRDGWRQIRASLEATLHLPDLGRLLVCIVFYQAGIQTVIALAAIYAQQALGFSTADTIVLVLVVNVTAALGALGFGQLQDRLGHERTLGLTLAGWIVMTLLAWHTETRTGFWMAANLAGVCLGASQSAGRAMVGYLSPPGRHAEMFGLWGLAVKLSAILGPLTYGLVSWTSGGDHRLAMLVTGLFFVAGLAILAGIDMQRGRRTALAASDGSARMNTAVSPLASRLPEVGTTIFTVMSQLALQHQAVNLGQGFPDFDCDPRLQALVTEAMQAGHNQYAPMAGVPALREAIAAKTERLYGHAYDPETEITVTAGATQAIATAVLAATRPGDEVIVIEPAYDSYVPAIRMAGAVPVFVQMDAGYAVPWEKLRAAITPRTRLIIVNSPNNPSGAVFCAGDLDELERSVRGTGILLLSDEVYEHIVFDGVPHQSLARRPALAERAFIVSSFGKTFHATGWKIGYCCAPRALSAEFRKLHQFIVFAVSSPMQHALARWLQDPGPYEGLPAFYQARRDRFRAGLAATRLRLLPCPGTYFQLVDYAAVSDESEADFARRLTVEHGVAAIPTSAFYAQPQERHIVRFCFGKKPETLDRALERLARL